MKVAMLVVLAVALGNASTGSAAPARGGRVARIKASATDAREYKVKVGEAYKYDASQLPSGLLLLRQDAQRVIFVEVISLTPGRYQVNGGFFNCDLGGGQCLAFTPDLGEVVYGSPPPTHILGRAMRDARAGRLKVFSNAGKFLAQTPW